MSAVTHLASQTEQQLDAVTGDAFWKIAIVEWLRKNCHDWNIVYLQGLISILASAIGQVWIARQNGIRTEGPSAHAKSQIIEADLAGEVRALGYGPAMELMQARLDIALGIWLKPYDGASGASDDPDGGGASCKLEEMAWELDALEADINSWTFSENPVEKEPDKKFTAECGKFRGTGKSARAAQFNAIAAYYFK